MFAPGPTKVGHAMFSSCLSLKTVTLPDTVTEIDNEAFYHAGIEKLVIPDGVTRIGQSAFSHCGHLTDILIPASVTEIAENAFTECPKFRVHADSGSYAERYAKQHHMMMTAVPINPAVFTEPEPEAVQPQQTAPVPQRRTDEPPAADPAFLWEKHEPADTEPAAAGKEQSAEPEKPVPAEEPKPKAAKKSAQKAEPPAEASEKPAEKEAAKPVGQEPVKAEEAKPEKAAEASAEPEPAPKKRRKTVTFDEEEEQNYAERIKRELEDARKNSVKADPKVKLPKLVEEPAEPPAPKQKKRRKKELTEEERELKLRAKETPEETKARHRAKLLEDLPELPDLPEERVSKKRPAPEAAKPEPKSAEAKPEDSKPAPKPVEVPEIKLVEPIPAEPKSDLLSGLPDVPELPPRKKPARTIRLDIPMIDEVKPINIPKVDEGAPPPLSAEAEQEKDPFADADIHWNSDQTTFTIRF